MINRLNSIERFRSETNLPSVWAVLFWVFLHRKQLLLASSFCGQPLWSRPKRGRAVFRVYCCKGSGGRWQILRWVIVTRLQKRLCAWLYSISNYRCELAIVSDLFWTSYPKFLALKISLVSLWTGICYFLGLTKYSARVFMRLLYKVQSKSLSLLKCQSVVVLQLANLRERTDSSIFPLEVFPGVDKVSTADCNYLF